MQALLRRLERSGVFDIIIFDEDVILNSDVGEWPIVECFISFHGTGRALEKACEYVKLRKPVEINKTCMQSKLLNRLHVYETLKEWGIPCPDFICIDHTNTSRILSPDNEKLENMDKNQNQHQIRNDALVDLHGYDVIDPHTRSTDSSTETPMEETHKIREESNSNFQDKLKNKNEFSFLDPISKSLNTSFEFEEHPDYISYKERKLFKPFVEKPLSGNDHNIWIYYPQKAGGGCKKLFRKQANKSSQWDSKVNSVRTDGVYVYEPFHSTGGTDIKVYMVGQVYSHAEARKAPTVDGKVMRNEHGKEIRYPIILSELEKAYGALIVMAFGQYVCGFDVLRTEGGSIICDVNGWSAVKGNPKYWDDCALLIQRFFFDVFRVSVSPPLSSFYFSSPFSDQDKNESNLHCMAVSGEKEEARFENDTLRSVLIVMRHGDRKPKEKIKFNTSLPLFVSYINQRSSYLSESDGYSGIYLSDGMQNVESNTKSEVLLKTSDELGSFTRKLDILLESEHESISIENDTKKNLEVLQSVLHLHDEFTGINRKIQIKPKKWGVGFNTSMNEISDFLDNDIKEHSINKNKNICTEVQVVAKWGGEITSLGVKQAELLGRQLRSELYHLSRDDPVSLLRLHSTFRHDFKIYSSSEGRCQTTAAAFTRGFLDLEGDLPSILVSLVTTNIFTKDLLDQPIPRDEREHVKTFIDNILHINTEDINTMKIVSDVGRSIKINKNKNNNSRSISALPELYDLHKLMVPTSHIGSTQAAFNIGNPFKTVMHLRNLCSSFIECVTKSIEELDILIPTPSPESVHVLTELSRIVQRWKKLLKRLSREKEENKELRNTTENSLEPEEKEDKKMTGIGIERNIFSSCDNNTNNVCDCPVLSIPGTRVFECSNIPDLWDSAYHDLIHHKNDLSHAAYRILEDEIFPIIKSLQDWIAPTEFGISELCKLRIGVETSWRLLQKLLNDCEFVLEETNASGQNVWTRSRMSSIQIQGNECKPQNNETGNDKNHVTEFSAKPVIRESVPSQNLIGNASKELRRWMKQAMQDESDWHPKLEESLSIVKGMKSTNKCVRSRIYVTSASTMHSILNVFRNLRGFVDTDALSNITDLHYLSYAVIRVFEHDTCAGGYRVQLDFSSGIRPSIGSAADCNKMGNNNQYIDTNDTLQVEEQKQTFSDETDHYVNNTLKSLIPKEDREIQNQDTRDINIDPMRSILKGYLSLEDFSSYIISVVGHYKRKR